MQVLLYNKLKPAAINGFQKWHDFMLTDDLKSADIKKIGDNLYRARLNRSDRLLLSFYRYQSERYALVLEYLPNHNYEGSRFLRHGVKVDEDKIPALTALPENPPQLTYVNPQHGSFNLLGKVIAFDNEQQNIFDLKPPLILIGSAGSGKTALTLEKLKACQGSVLYVTHSPYLVKHSRDLYFSHQYSNEYQDIEFLSFAELLESIEIPEGKLATLAVFMQWYQRIPRPEIRHAHKLYEEIKGVLTATADTAYLSEEDYLALGVRQSIFPITERPAVYDLFQRYVQFLQQHDYYDSNLLSFAYLSKVAPRYDFIAIDEVQDFTNVQLVLMLRLLQHPEQFLLCGDANQIVHPNFFSWDKIKQLFYQQQSLLHDQELIRILHTNYRNSAQITTLANRLLCLKQARFGSIDRESNYLINSNQTVVGSTRLFQENAAICEELNQKTRTSTQFAVLVMYPEQKAAACQHFQTPLVFSIQEAKGLEYDNIILYNFLSEDHQAFQTISAGIQVSDLQSLRYARPKDKQDKSLETYKFYINALYVALTRAVRNLYWIESRPQQSLLELLEIPLQNGLELSAQQSDLEAWQREAHKLELQGKQEQAERIRSEVLRQQTPDWTVYQGDNLKQLWEQAFPHQQRQARLQLFEYALIYDDRYLLHQLVATGFKPARFPQKGLQQFQQKYLLAYLAKKPIALRQQLDRFGVNFRTRFNHTPLMLATWLGKPELVTELVQRRAADTNLTDNHGMTAFQIALQQACQDEKYARHKLAQIYPQLRPDGLSVQVDARLLKLEPHSSEFFLLNVMIALFYQILPAKLLNQAAFSAHDIADALQHFPNEVIPTKRKQHNYIASILARNEIYRDDLHNRRLFYRLKKGQYLFNPTLMLKIDEEWVNIYDLLRLDKLAFLPRKPPSNWGKTEQVFYDQRVEQGREFIQQHLQQVRTEMLNQALSVLQVLCVQELERIQSTP